MQFGFRRFVERHYRESGLEESKYRKFQERQRVKIFSVIWGKCKCFMRRFSEKRLAYECIEKVCHLSFLIITSHADFFRKDKKAETPQEFRPCHFQPLFSSVCM